MISRDEWLAAVAAVSEPVDTSPEAITMAEFADLIGLKPSAAKVRMRALVQAQKARPVRKQGPRCLGTPVCDPGLRVNQGDARCPPSRATSTFSTALRSLTSLQNQTMRTCVPVPSQLRIPEPLASHLACPKCHAENVTDLHHYIWRVADERGLHAECDCCSHAWWPWRERNSAPRGMDDRFCRALFRDTTGRDLSESEVSVDAHRRQIDG
jgi:hypothetical protein